MAGKEKGRTIQRKLAVGFLFLIIIGALGLTFSRSAWMAFFFSMVLWTFFTKRHAVWIILVIGIFLGVFYPQMVKTRNVTFVSDSVKMDKKKMQVDDKDNIFHEKYWQERLRIFQSRFTGMGRKNYWTAAIGVIQDHPFVGAGLNTYSQLTRERKIKFGGYPHNCYLQLTAETGLLGLFTFLWIFAACYYYGLRSRSGLDEERRVLLNGLLAGLTAFLIQGFFDTSFYSVQLGVYLWVILACIVHLAGSRQEH
jgi:O-antigen ligase